MYRSTLITLLATFVVSTVVAAIIAGIGCCVKNKDTAFKITKFFVVPALVSVISWILMLLVIFLGAIFHFMKG